MRSRRAFAAALFAGWAFFLPSCSQSHGPDGGGGGGTDSLAALACANAQAPTPVTATRELGDSTPVIGSEKVFYRITLRPNTTDPPGYLGWVRLGIPAAGRYRLYLSPQVNDMPFGVSGPDGNSVDVDGGSFPENCPDTVKTALEFNFAAGNQRLLFGTGIHSIVGLMVVKL